jgi:succinate dehydrogenase / fumarate reductase flavoprotein subunit
MLKVVQMIATAALRRTESRGAHFRSDFPTEDNDAWLKHLRVVAQNGTLQLSEFPVNLSELEPPAVSADTLKAEN